MAEKLRSVQACENGAWTLLTWKKDDPVSRRAVRFRCKSWRHPGDCQKACGACDFIRIAAALKSRKKWCFATLTYPRKDWPDRTALFRFGVVSWARLRKRLTYHFGALAYVQTWEAHQSGYPHCHLAVQNGDLWDAVGPGHASAPRWWFRDHCVACGFGRQCDISQARNKKAISSYLTKLGLELSGASVKNQIPIEAPPHFRRIRASRGLLPKRVKDETMTGVLLNSPIVGVLLAMGVNPEAEDAGE